MPLSSAVPHRPAPEETINDPTNPKHYWRFRMHVALEDLLGDTAFTGGLREMMAGARPCYRDQRSGSMSCDELVQVPQPSQQRQDALHQVSH